MIKDSTVTKRPPISVTAHKVDILQLHEMPLLRAFAFYQANCSNPQGNVFPLHLGIILLLSHNHHFKWWFGLALIRAGYTLAQKGGYRKRCYWSSYKAVLLESSFLDSSACSLIYFFIASSVILPIVET